MITIEGFGDFKYHERYHQLQAVNSIQIPVLGRECRVVIDGHNGLPIQGDFMTALRNFMLLSPEVITSTEEEMYHFYKDMNDTWCEPGDECYVDIPEPAGVWKHVRLGNAPTVTRRAYGDEKVYISIECECDWDTEHGLQIVLKEGLRVNKIGRFDGHVTNSDAFGDDSLETVIYHSVF